MAEKVDTPITTKLVGLIAAVVTPVLALTVWALSNNFQLKSDIQKVESDRSALAERMSLLKDNRDKEMIRQQESIAVLVKRQDATDAQYMELSKKMERALAILERIDQQQSRASSNASTR